MAVSRYVICLAELFQQENLKNKNRKENRTKNQKQTKKFLSNNQKLAKILNEILCEILYSTEVQQVYF